MEGKSLTRYWKEEKKILQMKSEFGYANSKLFRALMWYQEIEKKSDFCTSSFLDERNRGCIVQI